MSQAVGLKKRLLWRDVGCAFSRFHVLFEPDYSFSSTIMTFAAQFLQEVQQVAQRLDLNAIEQVAGELARVRERGGRLFILGLGGSAANASHAVNDFRKICGFECYAPTDNVSELTARANDEGWETIFSEWLKGSHLSSKDGLLIFSVGGGDL